MMAPRSASSRSSPARCSPGRCAGAARRCGRAARAAIAAVILAAGISTFLALRDGIVGPDAHAAELRSIEATAKTGPTAFLEQSDFGGWDLFALRPYRPTLLYKVNVLPTRRQKDWHQGMTMDLDGMSSATINRFKWIVSPNTAFASFPPPGLPDRQATPSWIPRSAPAPSRRADPQRALAAGRGPSMTSAAGRRLAPSHRHRDRARPRR